jgi:hypothetical protein
MIEALSDVEIAELRRYISWGELPLYECHPRPPDWNQWEKRVLRAAGRLLDEVQQLRRRDAENIAGEGILHERIQSLERTMEILRREAHAVAPAEIERPPRAAKGERRVG